MYISVPLMSPKSEKHFFDNIIHLEIQSCLDKRRSTLKEAKLEILYW